MQNTTHYIEVWKSMITNKIYYSEIRKIKSLKFFFKSYN